MVSAPAWGWLSDREGRRLPLLVGLAGNAASLAVFGLTSSLPVLYAARVVGGLFSGAILPTATAYVSDVTDPRLRGQRLAWLGSAASFGIVIGPALGAALATLAVPDFWDGVGVPEGFAIPFLAAASIVAFAWLFATRWLPPSQPSVVASPVPQAVDGSAGASITLGWLLPYAFLVQFGLALFEGTFALHASAEIGFGPREMALVFATCGLVMAGIQGTVIAWLFTRVREPLLVRVGFVVMGTGLGLMMVSRDLVVILAFVGFFALGTALVTPALASLVSKATAVRTGAALGLQSASGSLGQAVGPPAGAALLLWNVHTPYLLAAILLVIAAIAWTVQSRAFGKD